ncbi:AI-2E family transporter [Rhizobium halophytocola]|uniref:PurR-regulated permease PerM n=1 Tax=Rhizobium halophytocola TaxID=735519 RepID=A0ABS4E4N1_9HYPH|nr:AI-2E family transporter [Rhizobium halophytocola]MBP1852894.1 putative PurR-regulated permease PerM [Rhizobium halophytocola]
MLELTSEPVRRRVSVAAVLVTFALFLLFLPGTTLIIFGGILIAILVRSCGTALGRFIKIKPIWGVSLVLIFGSAILALFCLALAPSISGQIDEFSRQIPGSLETLRSRMQNYSWAKGILAHIDKIDFWSAAWRGKATTAVTSAFGYIGNTIILLFIAIYGALDPGTYRRGLLALFAPSLRSRADVVLDRSVATLHQWLMAKLIAMCVVGVLTFIGLWFVGIPLALVLGLLAGLLAFIPNLGPVIAAAPGLLLALPQGTHTVLLVLGVYLAVQTLESYVITPIIQQQKVALPPLLVISSQLIFGSLFGLGGLALATPLTALGLQLVSDLYVTIYLEQSEPSR